MLNEHGDTTTPAIFAGEEVFAVARKTEGAGQVVSDNNLSECKNVNRV